MPIAVELQPRRGGALVVPVVVCDSCGALVAGHRDAVAVWDSREVADALSWKTVGPTMAAPMPAIKIVCRGECDLAYEKEVGRDRYRWCALPPLLVRLVTNLGIDFEAQRKALETAAILVHQPEALIGTLERLRAEPE
jgi:hypothetical protein